MPDNYGHYGRLMPPTRSIRAVVATAALVAACTGSGADDPQARLSGLIAVAGPTGLRILKPTGELVVELAEDMVVTQPTWSRAGTSLAATLIDRGSGTAQVAVVDTATWELTATPAYRPYFFYTWNHDGSLLAALGPGRQGGTSVDILDAAGAPAANSPIEGNAMYVAWEPGGDDLLLHADDRLFLLDDPDAVETSAALGVVGTDFQAPSWIPGTRDVLYVDSAGTRGRLLRHNVDTAEIIDLGAAEGFVIFSVHPDGQKAALFQEGPIIRPGSGSNDGTALVSAQNALVSAQNRSPRVEMVDLVTGNRTPVVETVSVWLEWSPAGERLLVATLDGTGFGWHVWADQHLDDLGSFTPTPTFARDYMAFSSQYVESPRLWSPDGSAFGFGAMTDTGPVAAVTEASGAWTVNLEAGEVAFWSPR